MGKQKWVPPFRPPAMTYEEASALAHDTGFSGSTDDPLLETVVDLLDELGRPDAAFDIVQIAGTNGKTSTARYTAAILAGEGLRCALYTSPELVEMRERMEVAGAPVSPEVFAHGISLANGCAKRVNARRVAAGERPYRVTEFDLLTVAALCVFALQGVDVAVLEVGLGGRWDATTATYPVVTCVTGIGLDHMHILGDTLEEIAAEKAAIIKSGQRCVLGVGTWLPASVEDVLLAQCKNEGVEPVLVRPRSIADAGGVLEKGEGRSHEGLPQARFRVAHTPRSLGDALEVEVSTPKAEYQGLCAVKPAYQAANIACAVALAEAYLGRPLETAALHDSVASCPTPGRFDVLSEQPLHVIDASHNPQSIRALLSSLDRMEPEVNRRPMLLAAVLSDKDVEGIVALLAQAFSMVSVTATSSPRALPAAKLADIFRAHGKDPAYVFADVPAAVAALADEDYLACGSITLAGEIASLAASGVLPR